MRRQLAAGVCAAALLAPAGGAAAQEAEPAQLDVRRVVVPQSKAKLLDRGVRVLAACTPECVIVVKVKLPRSIAGKLGVRNRVVATGVGASDGSPVWVRAKLRRGAGELLEDYEGGGTLQVRIRALV